MLKKDDTKPTSPVSFTSGAEPPQTAAPTRGLLACAKGGATAALAAASRRSGLAMAPKTQVSLARAALSKRRSWRPPEYICRPAERWGHKRRS